MVLLVDWVEFGAWAELLVGPVIADAIDVVISFLVAEFFRRCPLIIGWSLLAILLV